MRRPALVVAAGLALAGAAWPAPAAASDHCCVAAGLAASYDAGAKRISAHWASPPGGVTAVELRAGDRLGVDGVVDLGARTVRAHAGAGSAGVAAGPLAVVLASHGGVFVQVRFVCASRSTGAPCRETGAFWSKPVHLTADEATTSGGAGKAPPGLELVPKRITITSNGTPACATALKAVKDVIAQLKANTAAAQQAAADGKSTTPYLARQTRLAERLDRLYAAAKATCAAR